MSARRILVQSRVALVLLILPFSTPASITRQTPASSARANRVNEQDEVIRVETNLITFSASVMDRDGRYITDLKKEDFQIFEDGVEQEVAFFAPVDRPFTILFLLDTSGSMTYRMEDLGRAANAFVGQLRPDDQLIVASFSDRVKVLNQVTSVKGIREGGVKFRLRAGGGSMIYDAVDDALKRMKKVRGRKAIVLFSDGYDSGVSLPFVTAKDNLRDAEEQHALIYTVQFDTSSAEPHRYVSKKHFYESIEAVNSYVRDLAQKTGGRRYQIERISDLGKTFGMVADELGRQYSLGYYPKRRLEGGQRRQIKVKVRYPNLAVRARDSYIVDKTRGKK